MMPVCVRLRQLALEACVLLIEPEMKLMKRNVKCACIFHGSGPQACSNSELTFETMNPFRHFVRLLGRRIGPSQSFHVQITTRLSIPWTVFEPTMPVFESSKTIRTLDSADTYLLTYLLTYLSTHSLTPWCRILLGKLIVTQLVKKSYFLYGTRRFITVLTKACHWTLSWASRIQFSHRSLSP
jgi:hypothetical protein